MRMLTLTIDTTELGKTIDSMIAQLAAFPQNMADELTRWQVEDMHRRYPNTTLQGNTATTEIWPTSRLPKKKKPRGLPRKAPIRPASGVRIHSQRPILRPELFDKLDQRMVQLMGDKLQWR
jgi:hypothetical protein